MTISQGDNYEAVGDNYDAKWHLLLKLIAIQHVRITIVGAQGKVLASYTWSLKLSNHELC